MTYASLFFASINLYLYSVFRDQYASGEEPAFAPGILLHPQ